eukprot:3951709-Ditylum_brightwellii.AAC.1
MQRRRQNRARNNKFSITSPICTFNTAHAVAVDMPKLIDYRSSDKEERIIHQYESDFDFIDDGGLDNRKIPAQPSRNEIENM